MAPSMVLNTLRWKSYPFVDGTSIIARSRGSCEHYIHALLQYQG